ncbi:1758_t:CDS:10 [Ambispora leptoticha]|uniref:1758_t:CDS:1 n=1 Tax=Ambispora leptoticha TaxID=144679 RepID=A0A9N8V867_9GLOM|nr:1758_t:CDS:10 [Ambispora leptoticha]
MGVKGLWSLLEPVARPIKLESLNNKKLAIDILTLKQTMRDKEGNSLKNAHLLGFFRRICKLLFYNIKPVFVFDGGVPALKRQTVVERRKRRAGKTKNLQKTAEKILANQLRLRAIKESDKKNDDSEPNTESQSQPVITDNTVYYGEHNLTPAQLHKRKKRDEYELPPIIGGIESMIQKDDIRFANEEDLRRFIEEFKVNSDDIDIDSEGFRSLPLEMQFEIVGELRLKSRQTSYERLQNMIKKAPISLIFFWLFTTNFKNQILALTLIGNNALGNNKTTESPQPVRIAAERNREYVLIKNDDGFGGWTMGKSKTKPIKLESSSESDENDDWEEVNASIIASDLNEKENLDDDENLDEDEDLLPPELYPDTLKGKIFALHDEKIETIMAKFNAFDKTHEPLFSEGQTEEELDLPLESYYALWVSRMPPDFRDEFSNHETLVRTALYEWDEEELKSQKFVVEKKLGKLKDGDEKKLKIFEYWRNLLRTTLAWRQMRSTDVKEIVIDKTSKMETSDSDFFIDDDYESEDNTKNARHDKDTLLLSNTMEASSVNETDDSLEVDSFSREELSMQSNSIDIGSQRKNSVNNTEYEGNGLASDVNDLSTSDKANKNVEKMQQEINESSSQSVSSNKDIEIKRHITTNVNTESKPELDLNLINDNQQEETTSIDNDNRREAETNEIKENDNANADDVSTQMVEENSEFARFMSQLKHRDLNEIRRELENEIETLNQQQRREMRDTDELTQSMINDCQQLLQLFGIPYIVAPMEAEAQCAELCRLSLVDGIVTDDSDIFLFGGTRVYKNMFNQQQFVECFLMQDLEQEMNLDREKLIRLAYLLGSDYTEGLPGVGVVTAMEILNEFSGNDGLEKFEEWWNSKKSRKDLILPDDFLNRHVREAYINPQVDDSTIPIEWGVPDLNALTDFLMSNLLWAQEKIDETLIPIIRNMNQRNAESISAQRQQTTIDSFFDMTVDDWKRKDKRSESGTSSSSEENNDSEESNQSSTTRATRRNLADEQGKAQEDNDVNMTSGTSSSDDSSEESNSDDDKDFSMLKRGQKSKTAKYSRFFPRPTKKTSRAKTSNSNTSKKSMGGSSRGRGRGAGRGKGTRARGRGRGRSI